MKDIYGFIKKLKRKPTSSVENKGERRESGSITIFLSCILLPMIIAEMTIINLCALTATKQIANDAGKMSTNAALTDYNERLHDMYGLMAFDGDGTEAASRMEDVFQSNLNTKDDRWGYKNVYAGYGRNWSERESALSTMGRKRRSATVDTSMIPSSALSNKDVFKGQICDAMRYNYKATERITAEDLEYYSKYPDSVDAIKAKMEYDTELSSLYDDAQNLVEEMKKNVIETEGAGENGAKIINYDHLIYEHVEEIKTLCDDALSHKTVLEQKKSEWKNANQRSGLSDELRSVLKRSYDEEMNLDLYFEEIENIKNAMSDFDFTTKVYEKYLTTESVEYIAEDTEAWDRPIDAVKIMVAFRDFTEASEDYKELKKEYGKYWEGYDSAKTTWESEKQSSLNNNKADDTISWLNGNENFEAYYEPVSPVDLKFGETASSGNNTKLSQLVSNYINECEKAASYFKNMDGAIYAVNQDNAQLLISEYATEFFGSFHRTDNFSLTGWYISRSSLDASYIYTQQEHLMFGLSSAKASITQFNKLSYYTEYIRSLIDCYSQDYYGTGPVRPSVYGNLHPLDDSIATYLRKDISVLVNAKLEADRNYESFLYNWGQTEEGYTYAHFLKLFMLIQVTNNEDAVLSRMRNVIEMSVSAEEGSFSFDTAYTAATINAKIRVDGIIGGGSTYEYKNFAMY